jgi:hypothetical protein
MNADGNRMLPAGIYAGPSIRAGDAFAQPVDAGRGLMDKAGRRGITVPPIDQIPFEAG